METKYKIGDVVYGATSYKKDKQVQCPDCHGALVWSVTTPVGDKFTIPCYTCERGFEGCYGTITVWEQSPVITRLTIGSVRFDSSDEEHPVSYMCEETGVGSGTIHYQENLFKDKIGALKSATEKAVKICKEENEKKRKIYDLGKKRSRKNPTRI